MQGRMKQHQLTDNEINKVLQNAQVGRIATHNENGYPYIVPVHYIMHQDKIYIHGLIKGQKITNLIKDNRICFEVDEMDEIIPDIENVCDTNTKFRSIIILGKAIMVQDANLKKEVLNGIVNKYTPQLAHLDFPDKMMKATGVIEISILEMTGKYYQ